jgi:hypothetical protein
MSVTSKPWVLPTANEIPPWPVTVQTPWVNGAPIKKKLTLDEVLMQWQASKETLQAATEEEMRLRKLAVEMGFGKSAQEGTNNQELGNGYVLKAVIKKNYKLVKPENEPGNTFDAVDKVMDNFARISNEGAFIAERLFKYSVDLSVSEYKKLVEEATVDTTKAKLLAEANKVVLITDAAPTLDIKEPKAKKK